MRMDVEAKMAKGLSAMEAIRLKCLDCSGGSEAEVRDCQVKKCTLMPYRMGDAGKASERRKAIMEHCLWCMCGDKIYVRECGIRDTSADCPLWGFRTGRNPNRVGKMSEENKAKAVERLRIGREKKKTDSLCP